MINVLLKGKGWLKLWLLAIILLLLLNWFLKLRIEFLNRESQKNLKLLEQTLPGFNEQSLALFKQQIRNLKGKLVAYSMLLHPQERWLKEGYDISILFVDDLNNINQFLKNKASEKKVDFVDLNFPQKLPAESEAANFLSQLHGLKEVLNLGIDLGINFRSIKPESIERVEGLKNVWLARNSLDLVAPKEALAEFMIQLNDIVPRPCVDSLVIKSEENTFTMTLNFVNVLLNLDLGKDAGIPKVKAEDLPSLRLQNFIAILRNRNPFFVPLPKETPQAAANPAAATLSEGKASPRFIYRGKAVLKKKEVVVIEDTLNKETVFLGLKERLGNLRVKDFSDEEVILENAEDSSAVSIKKGAE